jgi:hypothetical protein
MSPISNYVTPGVYVTQSGTPLTTVASNNLNIAIVADQPTPGSTTDTFTVASAASGITIGQLTTPMVNTTSTGTYASYSGFTVTWNGPVVSGVQTVITGTYGTNFNISTSGAFSYLTTSGITATGTNTLPSGSVGITYGHAWGAYGTYTTFNSLVSAVGAAISGNTISNPATLAAQFAFQNGASTVSIQPVARIATSGTGPATTNDWIHTLTASSGTPSDPTYLMNFVGVDVVVPLYGFTNNGTVIPYGANTVASGLNSYLNNQQAFGILQRAFIGVDGTTNQVTASALQALATAINSTRITLSYPSVVNYNPGFNPTTGLSTASFNIPGYYVAAALAGLFVGQPTVATPITNKVVYSFNSIPNQISDVDAATNYLPYGISVVRQKRDGNFWVYQGLTTNVTSWVTQEISINAISDALSKQIKNALVNSELVGGPLTNVTSAAVLGTVQSSLTSALSAGLIQSYQNLQLSLNPASPTTVFVTFQYAPTYPINYIQVSLSLNTQTGTVVTQNAQSNFVVY